MIDSVLAIIAGACFSGAFVLPDPYWFVSALMSVLMLAVLRGGLRG